MVPGADSIPSDHKVCTEFDDDQSRGRAAAQGGDDIGDIGLGAERHGSFGKAEARRAHADLGRRFLARKIDDAGAVLGKLGCRLEQKRRLADTWIAADQHGGAGHQPAAEHAIEFGDAGLEAGGVEGLGGQRLEGGQTPFAAFDGDEGRGARSGG